MNGQLVKIGQQFLGIQVGGSLHPELRLLCNLIHDGGRPPHSGRIFIFYVINVFLIKTFRLDLVEIGQKEINSNSFFRNPRWRRSPS